MADAQVTCVTMSAPSHEAITGAGGVDWWWTVDQIIESIDARTNTFFTMDAVGRADVRTVSGPTRKYIRTVRDGRQRTTSSNCPAAKGIRRAPEREESSPGAAKFIIWRRLAIPP